MRLTDSTRVNSNLTTRYGLTQSPHPTARTLRLSLEADFRSKDAIETTVRTRSHPIHRTSTGPLILAKPAIDASSLFLQPNRVAPDILHDLEASDFLDNQLYHLSALAPLIKALEIRMSRTIGIVGTHGRRRQTVVKEARHPRTQRQRSRDSQLNSLPTGSFIRVSGWHPQNGHPPTSSNACSRASSPTRNPHLLDNVRCLLAGVPVPRGSYSPLDDLAVAQQPRRTNALPKGSHKQKLNDNHMSIKYHIQHLRFSCASPSAGSECRVPSACESPEASRAKEKGKSALCAITIDLAR
ncbi:uncharacterized protein MYCFIDRAFT_180493 [Pseudocercospora fijiensis CIRAD86]|uniref:Uncharacterized protein n=1 Tax=Pseudocercospora fijiensis (strain CIRAD86) TaxID=383855 RepID=M2YGR8_PSEFD|nr:uncharacterized protein MYCFIDRAFT_180493 [Pseudocercospora fijiensis CIRAD86]EME77005.1 hypothetical protein MYCFIDRAFT_180493 [Pseudocercospora fijiensis CIRAD86]